MIKRFFSIWHPRSLGFIFIIFLASSNGGASELPDPLVCPDGTIVADAEHWFKERRPEILSLFETHVYGKTPGLADSILPKTTSSLDILDGKATLTQVDLTVYAGNGSIVLHLLEIMPKNKNKNPVGCFVGLNFWGNQTLLEDTSIRITDKWMLDYQTPGIEDHYATEKSRGTHAYRWPIEMIIDNGYGLIVCHNADIGEDTCVFNNGAHTLFPRSAKTAPDSSEWGILGAWAWGMCRMVDYMYTQEAYDKSKIIAIGHSRLGKAALWAAAQDTRFSAVISNNSGCGGAAISRNKKGERLADINKAFPHWFCDKFKSYNNLEHILPIDQHMLLALIAPRPLYVASATLDEWADPEKEFLATTLVRPVYILTGATNTKTLKMPVANKPQIGTISYHLRDGEHDLTPWDWQQYLKFANKVVGARAK